MRRVARTRASHPQSLLMHNPLFYGLRRLHHTVSPCQYYWTVAHGRIIIARTKYTATRIITLLEHTEVHKVHTPYLCGKYNARKALETYNPCDHPCPNLLSCRPAARSTISLRRISFCWHPTKLHITAPDLFCRAGRGFP